jgi:hypothetical protein
MGDFRRPRFADWLDTSKHVFQLHGVNSAEEPVLRKKLRRQDSKLSSNHQLSH